jgi:electron transport complex protein RnfB
MVIDESAMSSDARARLARELDAWLPQTQCTQCGYPHCRAYAEAIAAGSADINQCPPGDVVTIAALARLTGRAARPLNPRHGMHTSRALARIDEVRCIGCRKCIDVCPVDAIVGARKLMHTVVQDECTGCALCVPVCPVDCIAMRLLTVPSPREPWPDISLDEAAHWRARKDACLQRLAHKKPQRRARRTTLPTREQMRAEIRAAVARVQARKRVKPV